MPLDSLNRVPLDPQKKGRIEALTQGKAKLAIDLVEYDPKFEPAILQIFGFSWVCDDQDAASKICNRERMVSVTMQGEKYNPDGIMHGGYMGQGSDLLLKIQAYI